MLTQRFFFILMELPPPPPPERRNIGALVNGPTPIERRNMTWVGVEDGKAFCADVFLFTMLCTLCVIPQVVGIQQPC